VFSEVLARGENMNVPFLRFSSLFFAFLRFSSRVLQRVDKDKGQGQQHERPVEELKSAAESRKVVEHQKEHARAQVQQQQEPVVRKPQQAQRAAEVRCAVEQAQGVEQMLFKWVVAVVAEESREDTIHWLWHRPTLPCRSAGTGRNRWFIAPRLGVGRVADRVGPSVTVKPLSPDQVRGDRAPFRCSRAVARG